MRSAIHRAGVAALAVIAMAAGLSAAAAAQGRVWNESEIVEALGVKERGNGVGKYFVAADGLECEVSAIMKTGSSVRMYESAGDVIATNPDKTAGAKITGTEARTCMEEASKLLEKLR